MPVTCVFCDWRFIPAEASEITCAKRDSLQKKPQGPDNVPVTVSPQSPDQAELNLPWSSGVQQLEDFRLERMLGQGGMGAVYLARSLSTGMLFAVKRTRLSDHSTRLAFLRELQNWIDLPEHSHLTTCHFFRSLGDEIVIFAEYVDGGSLTDWLSEGRLNNLETILDVAIQFAWGLGALHSRGLVHQDIKPSNCLITMEGVAKITDFGLAAGQRIAAQDSSAVEEKVKRSQAGVTLAGCTPAYRSPEQAGGVNTPFQGQGQGRGVRLTPASDIWSWGLCLLEMLVGSRSWSVGETGAEVLEEYIQVSGVIPPGLVTLLKRCLEPHPEARLPSLSVAADMMAAFWQTEFGRPYSRAMPHVTEEGIESLRRGKEATASGHSWVIPLVWLSRAHAAACRDPRELLTRFPRSASSFSAQGVAELAIYEECVQIFEQLVADGRTDLRHSLAIVLFLKARVHHEAGDDPGNLLNMDRCIALLEQQTKKEGPGEDPIDLARAYDHRARTALAAGDLATAMSAHKQVISIMGHAARRSIPWVGMLSLNEGPSDAAIRLALAYDHRARAALAAGDLAAAMAAYEQAIPIMERLVGQKRQAMAVELSQAYTGRALTLMRRGDLRAALAGYDQAITLLEHLPNTEDRPKALYSLAKTFVYRADLLTERGELREAVAGYDQAIQIFERLSMGEERSTSMEDLAVAYAHRGLAAAQMREHHAALAGYERAILLLLRAVETEGRERDVTLSIVYTNRASSQAEIGDHSGAVASCDQAIKILTRLVYTQGRRELAHRLAATYTNKGIALEECGALSDAAQEHNNAILIFERLVINEQKSELAPELAGAYMSQANLLRRHGDLPAAQQRHGQAVELFERLVNGEGRWELADSLGMAYLNRAVVLTDRGELPTALAGYDQAVGVFERLVNEGRQELASNLAKVYLNRARVFETRGDFPSAWQGFNQAAEILHRLENVEGNSELAADFAFAHVSRLKLLPMYLESPQAQSLSSHKSSKAVEDLASAWINRALVLSRTGDLPGALEGYDRGIAMRERCFHLQGHKELFPKLVEAYMLRAAARKEGDDLRGVVIDYQHVISIYEELPSTGFQQQLNSLLTEARQRRDSALEAHFSPDSIPTSDQTIQVCEFLVNQEGWRELASDLAMAHMHRARALEKHGNSAGAQAEYSQAVAILERLVCTEGREVWSVTLATAYMKQCLTLKALGNLRDALSGSGRAIAVMEGLTSIEESRQLTADLAQAYIVQAELMWDLGDIHGAVAKYDRSIALRERLLRDNEGSGMAHRLAWTHASRALALEVLDNLPGALAAHDRAIAIYEQLVQHNESQDVAPALAQAYVNRAIARRAAGDCRGTVIGYTEAIGRYEDLVNRCGRREFAGDLAKAGLRRADAIKVHVPLVALQAYDQVILVYELLVDREGRHELANDLAEAHVCRANALVDQYEFTRALAGYDQAVTLLERLVYNEGRCELAISLAATYTNRAIARGEGGDSAGALAEYDKAIPMLEHLLDKESQQEQLNDLAWAYANRAYSLMKVGSQDAAVREGRRAVVLLQAKAARYHGSRLRERFHYILTDACLIDLFQHPARKRERLHWIYAMLEEVL